MCGLVGVITSANNGLRYDQKKWFDEAMTVNQFRGMHATGTFAIDTENMLRWYKVLGGFSELYKAKDGKAIEEFIYQKSRTVVGHGRFATRGQHDDIKCAHPFEVKIPKKDSCIVLVHNGTLATYQPFYDGLHKSHVDSFWMAELIAKHDPVEVFSKVRGAIATMWYNNETERFYVYRNNQRPLVILEGVDHSIYIASEKAILSYAYYKANLQQSNVSEMREIPVETLLEINPETLEIKETEVKIKEAEVKHYSLPFSEGSTYYPSNYSYLNNTYNQEELLWKWATLDQLKSGILSRKIEKATFIDGTRRIFVKLANSFGIRVISVENTPPVPNLREIKMSNDETKFIMEYTDNSIHVETVQDWLKTKSFHQKPAPKSRMVFERHQRNSKARIKMKDDKIFKITTDTDGSITVGKKLSMEVVEAYPRQNETIFIEGIPLTSVNDNGLFSVCGVVFGTRESVFKPPFFDGVVKEITLVQTDDKNKPVFRVLMEDLTQVELLDDPEVEVA